MAVLAAVTVYEAALALGAISIGDLPGEDARGASFASTAGVLALFGGLGVAVASIGAAATITSFLRQLLPLAGGAFVVAAGYSFDPYYAPSLRRYVDGGFAPAWWFLSVAAAAVVAAVLSRVRARAGMSATALVMLICLCTFLFRGVGK